MARTFLAGFRDADSRSLARALALLFVVAGCLSAVDAGRMAAGFAGGGIICSTNGAGNAAYGHPTLPATHDHCFCCALGCTAAAPGVLAIAVARLTPGPPGVNIRPLSRISCAVPMRWPSNGSPRGPPVLA